MVMRRRAMLGEEVESGYPYHLIAGSRNNGFNITTTEEGHITIYNANRQTSGKYLHFRDVMTYFTNQQQELINNCPKWFTLKAGQEITFTVTPYHSVFKPMLYIANTATVYKEFTAQSTTFTVEEDVDIGSLGSRTASSVETGSVKEMDVALYVDGERYF